MRVVPIIFASVALAWWALANGSEVAKDKDEPPPFGASRPFQSLVQVLAQRGAFHARSVKIAGLLSWDGIEQAIYFNSDAYEHGCAENAIWISTSEMDEELRAAFKRHDKKRVTVSGIYDSTANGDKNLYGGSLRPH
jgi:hypothetical protein